MSTYWRLRIRNAADDGDALVISSVSGGTNPYVVLPPTGDGQTLDPLGGAFTVASYQVQVIDADVAGARVVTDVLADANGRTQLLSRRAYMETSTDGSTWTVLVPGWVNQIRLIKATTYEVTVGETRRLEQTRKVFQAASSGSGWDFTKVTCLVGGPIVGGNWGPIADLGPWTFKVIEVGTGYVTMQFVRGYLYDYNAGQFRTLTGLPVKDNLRVENDRINAIARPLYVTLDAAVGAGSPYGVSKGSFPDIVCEVYGTGYSLLDGSFTPLGLIAYLEASSEVREDMLLTWESRPKLRIDWATTQPSVGTEFDVVMYPTKISPDNPIHWEGHPVDFAASCLASIGETVDATSITTVKAALGDDLWYRYRGTAAQTIGPLLEKECYGPFGFCPRIKSDGSYEFVTTRLRPADAPTETIDTSVAVDGSLVSYDADEKSQVNWMTWKQHNFTNWTSPSQGDRPSDFVVSQPQTYQPDEDDAELAPDLATYGQHEIVYDLDGGLATRPAALGDFSQHLLDPTRYIQAIHRQIFDWYGRGRDATDAAVYSGAIDATIGDFVTVQLPYKPGADATQSPTMQRNTERVMQVVQKTRGAGRDTFKLLDAGGTTQAGLVPTFTIAKSAARPRNVATVTLTNGAALDAAGVEKVRVEYALGASPTSGTLVGIMDTSDTTLDLPAVPSGSVVSARMRGEAKGQAPTAYSAFDDVTLDALPTPGSLTAGAGADDTETLLTWTVSDSSLALIVRWKLDAETVYGHSETLPAGSVQYTIRFLTPGASYDAEVSTLETSPYVGESTPATVSFTQGSTTPTLNPPTNPAVFAGTPVAGGGAIIDGSYGLEVTATEFPSTVVVEVAVETGVGAGTYGSYTTLGETPAVAGGRTRVTGYAPNDGLLRKLRAYQHREGATDSSYTTALTVDPWGVTATPPPIDNTPAFVTIGNDSTLTNERALTAGPGVDVVDAGAGSTVTVKLAGISALVAGDIYYAQDTSNLIRLPIGSEGDRLTVVSGVPAWSPATVVEDFVIANSDFVFVGSDPVVV